MSVLVIAEVGSVPDGSFGNALHLIDAAAECGAVPSHFVSCRGPRTQAALSPDELPGTLIVDQVWSVEHEVAPAQTSLAVS